MQFASYPISHLTILLVWQSLTLQAAEPSYLLKAELLPGTTTQVTAKIEVGGEMLVADEAQQKQLPLEVRGDFEYQEKIVAWKSDSQEPARSIRQYDLAEAHIKVAEQTSDRQLPEDQRLLLSELRNGESTLVGAKNALTREQFDLVNIVANSLSLDRLLPGREIAEGESWNHDKATVKALLAMDHVAVCEVSSVVIKESDRKVQIRLAGTVDGTVDGAPTEMELRCAYLFHLDEKRIIAFNMAIKETRKSTEIVPGLDVIAKAFVTLTPMGKTLKVPEEVAVQASRVQQPLERKLVYQSPTGGFSFEYDPAWYITAEERDLFSFRYLHDHQLTAHCNLSVLPPRSEGRHTSLDAFERDVREALSEKLETVSASTEWKTKNGYQCLGVIANGTVNEVPIQWRHYLVAADNCPRLSLAVTLEQSQGKKFADAERQMIDSLRLKRVELQTADKSATKAR